MSAAQPEGTTGQPKARPPKNKKKPDAPDTETPSAEKGRHAAGKSDKGSKNISKKENEGSAVEKQKGASGPEAPNGEALPQREERKRPTNRADKPQAKAEGAEKAGPSVEGGDKEGMRDDKKGGKKGKKEDKKGMSDERSAKPADKTMEKPAEKPTAKPASKVDKTADKAVDKAADKPAEKATAKPAEKPAGQDGKTVNPKKGGKGSAKPAAKEDGNQPGGSAPPQKSEDKDAGEGKAGKKGGMPLKAARKDASAEKHDASEGKPVKKDAPATAAAPAPEKSGDKKEVAKKEGRTYNAREHKAKAGESADTRAAADDNAKKGPKGSQDEKQPKIAQDASRRPNTAPVNQQSTGNRPQNVNREKHGNNEGKDQKRPASTTGEFGGKTGPQNRDTRHNDRDSRSSQNNHNTNGYENRRTDTRGEYREKRMSGGEGQQGAHERKGGHPGQGRPHGAGQATHYPNNNNNGSGMGFQQRQQGSSGYPGGYHAAYTGAAGSGSGAGPRQDNKRGEQKGAFQHQQRGPQGDQAHVEEAMKAPAAPGQLFARVSQEEYDRLKAENQDLKQRSESLFSEVDNLRNKIETLTMELQKQVMSTAHRDAEMARHAEQQFKAEDQPIKFNVGGTTRVTTTYRTLSSRGDNYFTRLIKGEIPCIKDEEGSYFIDRNGKLFETILEFLRTGAVQISDGVMEPIIQEARYFGMLDLVSFLENLVQPSAQQQINNQPPQMGNSVLPTPTYSNEPPIIPSSQMSSLYGAPPTGNQMSMAPQQMNFSNYLRWNPQQS